MTHVESVAAAERKVVEAAERETVLEFELECAYSARPRVEESVLNGIDADLEMARQHRSQLVHALLAARAATCSECEGYGVKARIIQRAPDWEEVRHIERCPANCDAGRRRDA